MLIPMPRADTRLRECSFNRVLEKMRHVAVVDDVMSAGSALNELARNLKRAGAVRFTGLIAARTLPSIRKKQAAGV